MATVATESKRRTKANSGNSTASPLSSEELRKMHAYWRATNYLSVGQIYLLDNPLLRKPLKREHVKPRLLGHWGTSPGLNMLCVHLNRVIKKDDLDMIYIIGPGHGGPSLVAHAYLEGTYSEVYPNISQDAEGNAEALQRSSASRAASRVMLHPRRRQHSRRWRIGLRTKCMAYGARSGWILIVACVVGDGEAETGPLATGWHGNKFLNPPRDGCRAPDLASEWL